MRHEEWAVFYSAYVLGRLGEFAKPSDLTKRLIEAPLAGNRTESAAAHIFSP
ncbi:MAG: hypothetical protein AB1598_04380 [Thermodesulfobacteriota bacterium]